MARGTKESHKYCRNSRLFRYANACLHHFFPLYFNWVGAGVKWKYSIRKEIIKDKNQEGWYQKISTLGAPLVLSHLLLCMAKKCIVIWILCKENNASNKWPNLYKIYATLLVSEYKEYCSLWEQTSHVRMVKNLDANQPRPSPLPLILACLRTISFQVVLRPTLFKSISFQYSV